ncbi:MAG: hypothetical protein V1754_09430, partial [Pseudomonadota bacterium]
KEKGRADRMDQPKDKAGNGKGEVQATQCWTGFSSKQKTDEIPDAPIPTDTEDAAKTRLGWSYAVASKLAKENLAAKNANTDEVRSAETNVVVDMGNAMAGIISSEDQAKSEGQTPVTTGGWFAEGDKNMDRVMTEEVDYSGPTRLQKGVFWGGFGALAVLLVVGGVFFVTSRNEKVTSTKPPKRQEALHEQLKKMKALEQQIVGLEKKMDEVTKSAEVAAELEKERRTAEEKEAKNVFKAHKQIEAKKVASVGSKSKEGATIERAKKKNEVAVKKSGSSEKREKKSRAARSQDRLRVRYDRENNLVEVWLPSTHADAKIAVKTNPSSEKASNGDSNKNSTKASTEKPKK